MSGSNDKVGIENVDENINFSAYESMVNGETLREPDRLLNVPWLDLRFWRQTSLVAQYVSEGSLLGRVPVRALLFIE